MTDPCTARIKDDHHDQECVLPAGHTDPEYGTDHAGPEEPGVGRLRWRDTAVGAAPHTLGRPSLEDLDAEPDGGPRCCNGNAEDCTLCTDSNPDYPWTCPGHERTASNERIVGEAAQAAKPSVGSWTQMEARAFNAVLPALNKSGQWLPLSVRRAVANAILAELKRELDAFVEYENAINWMTTCTSCARMLDASHRELERAEKAEHLLKQYVDLVAVTHKYPITGGHDCLGENLSCAGCALAKQAQEHLERDQ